MKEVKLQFLHYPYKLLNEVDEYGGVRVSSVLDIGCTKLQTISARGNKKDFVDLYFVLQEYSLKELLMAMERKYVGVSYNRLHILKSLSYFEDAEQQPMPRMHREVGWELVKKRVLEAVESLGW